MKIKILVLSSVLFFFGCSNTKSDSATNTCSFPAPGLTKVTAFTFDPNTGDQCEQFNGTTSHWNGMSTSSTALVALPTALYNSGIACGSCFSIQGASATVVARVVSECPGCASDSVDMDSTSFTVVTGLSAGIGSVTVTAIPCPSVENVKVFMNTGTNPFYLNFVLANHVTPIKTVEVDMGSGFVSAPRVSNSGAFAQSFSGGVSATGVIKLTDIFDQVVTGSFTTAVSSTTVLTSQFGTCN